VSKADGTDYQFVEPQPNHLTSAISDEFALGGFPWRHMHGHPLWRAQEFNLDIFCDLSLLNLPANLFGD
jgi:hypothetical protein